MEILVYLMLFLLNSAHLIEAETPEAIFRQQGTAIEMGFCFGVDYIAVYRSDPERKQLLGNSSDESVPLTTPKDYQGRVSITNKPPLLGFQISQLSPSDSGLYHRQCWKDEKLVEQHQQQLFVCDQEIDSVAITVMNDGGAELQCKSNLIGQEGVTIQWYHEVFPNYTTTMFLDSSRSLEPQQDELKDRVVVRDGGTSLQVAASMLKSSHHFYCLVRKGEKCLSFHSTYLAEPEEVSVYASEGEKVVLACPTEHSSKDQRWKTPLGDVNTTKKSQKEGDKSGDQMYAMGSMELGNFSLVIPVLSKNLSGEYSCRASSLVVEFSLMICPTQDPREKLFTSGGEAVLECEIDHEEDNGVLWYRHRAPGKDQLILDSKERSMALPEYLRGRVSIQQDSYLHLSKLSKEDEGKYYCVVVGSADFLKDDEYVGSEGNDEEGYEDDYNYDDTSEPWLDADKCISKQVTFLKMRDDRLIESPPRDSTPAPAPEKASNTALLAGCVVGALVLIGVVIAVVVLKRRGTQKGPARVSNKKTKDTGSDESKIDPGCMEKLNSDENIA